MKNFIPCIICGKRATWSYMPGDENFCNNHVPRGCSCNRNEDGSEDLDELGRKQPCCEYNQINEDTHTDKSQLAFGWTTYYKYNPEKENPDNVIAAWEKKYKQNE
jgi:hypothetical protein